MWKDLKPTFVGKFKNKRLHGHGLRITYSEKKTMGLLIGYWLNGRISGPGISITENSILIGNFPNLKAEDVNQLQRFKMIDNKDYLRHINMKKPNFYDDKL